MAPYLSTDEIAKKLKLKGRATIIQWIKKRQVAPPAERAPSGAFLWTLADLPRLRALKKANAKRMRAGRPKKIRRLKADR